MSLILDEEDPVTSLCLSAIIDRLTPQKRQEIANQILEEMRKMTQELTDDPTDV